MTVQLSSARGYKNFAAGAIVNLPASEESALIAQGLATNSAAAITSGSYSTLGYEGRAAIAAGTNSVTVTCPWVTASTRVAATLNNAAVDGTLTAIRVVPAAGSFTITGNANATALVNVDWTIPTFGDAPIV